MTLDEFIRGAGGRERAEVTEPGFTRLYVRYATGKWLGVRPDGGDDIARRVLTLANAEAEEPGSGALSRLLERLSRDHPALTVVAELPHPRLAAFLRRHGFADLPRHAISSADVILVRRVTGDS